MSEGSQAERLLLHLSGFDADLRGPRHRQESSTAPGDAGSGIGSVEVMAPWSTSSFSSVTGNV